MCIYIYIYIYIYMHIYICIYIYIYTYCKHFRRTKVLVSWPRRQHASRRGTEGEGEDCKMIELAQQVRPFS